MCGARPIAFQKKASRNRSQRKKIIAKSATYYGIISVRITGQARAGRWAQRLPPGDGGSRSSRGGRSDEGLVDWIPSVCGLSYLRGLFGDHAGDLRRRSMEPSPDGRL